ncbi:RND family efflux transporter MFP subunit [Sphingomonas naasensis]|uniref:Efflux RND transporter periplasmic adaptor subunit n=1 Tax=Sphingomonas naasensis TaxID=1344951 RepID=A0A4S1WER8_9SPHN|nr:efflux RND transporter periplasmic adaptor subunit [Sphingomonas naasensis]NIJ21542.1 RND family efflux transporter MFP subunit [Sphingomonas naasensis]TGX41511.1 efflux RND transporter periplasmic adaptor subunit [Sphingomonas naasensis]
MNYEAGMFGRQERLEFTGEETTRKSRRWLWIVAAAIVVVGALAFFMMSGSKSEAPKGAAGKAGPADASQSQIPTVTVATPGRRTIETIVTGTGSLAARREMPVGVVGEGGVVTRVLVEPGSWVGKGAVLATVDRSVQAQTAESLAASVRVAQADARLAQSELDRAQRLVSNGFISKADIDRKTATRDQAQARVRVAQAQLAETQARNRRLDIRAPEAGLVLTRQVEPGQIVSGGSGVLFRMAMAGQMELRTQLSEVDLQRLRPGAQAQVTPTGTTQTFKGEVWQVSPVIDPQTRQGIARVSLSYDPALRPGGFASARIIAGGLTAVMLPQSAVQSDNDGNFVYIIDDKNQAVRRGVTTGDVSEAGVAITGGLNGSERVVLTAGAFLNPGQKVIPNLQKSK